MRLSHRRSQHHARIVAFARVQGGNSLNQHEVAHVIVEAAATLSLEDSPRAAGAVFGVVEEEGAVGGRGLRLMRWRAEDSNGATGRKP